MHTADVAIAFSGFRGAGKTTLAKLMSAVLSCPRVSFGDEVRKLAATRGLGRDVDTLSALGEELVSTAPRDLCERVLRQANEWGPGQRIVIDGVRHLQVRAILRQLVLPTRLVSVYIDLPDDVRRQRLNERGDNQDEMFTDHPVEFDLSNLKNTADIVVKNTESIEPIVLFIDQLGVE